MGSAVDLTFAYVSPRVLLANVKSETALLSYVCECPFNSSIRKGMRGCGMRMLEPGHSVDAHRYFAFARPCGSLHAGIRPCRRHGDAAAGTGRNQYPRPHQDCDRASPDADHSPAASRRL